MFRLQENTIGPDHHQPADLAKLGFFINDVGHIRMTQAPDKEYVFHSTNNDRFNEVRREAMQECSRQETEKRLSGLGINRIYLPEFTTNKPDGPHVPILAPSPEILKSRKRIIVVVNDAIQDLGILAYRQMQRELGLNGASAVNFVKTLILRSATGDVAEKYENIYEDGFQMGDDNDTPALVVLNTGQLLYSHKYNKALTMRSWCAMPRRSVAHDMIRIHDVENGVEGHRSPKEHVKSVFENVLCNPNRVAPDAEVYVIAIEGGTDYLLTLLGEDFQKYGNRITAMALIHSLIDDMQIKDPNLRVFLHQRAREWRYSDLSISPEDCTELPEDYKSSQDSPLGARANKHIAWNEDVSQGSVMSSITGAPHRLVINTTPSKEADDASAGLEDSDCWSSGQVAICPTFAGGRESTGECIFTYFAVQHAVLDFFEEVARNPENYRNPNFKVYNPVPQPTPENPLALDPDTPEVAGFASLPPEMTPEQAELDMAKEKLDQMRLALKACPAKVSELQQGRAKLLERIAKQEVKIEKLKKKALATGGLKSKEAPEQRENWKPQKEGVKVEFAGTEVDSELLKAAGLLDTAEEGLAKRGA